MIRTLAITKDLKMIKDAALSKLHNKDIEWYWVDFENPTDEEIKILEDLFHFHPLAIEDCLHFLQRPKLEYYDTYNFFVTHCLDKEDLDVEEINIFVGENFVVSFHQEASENINAAFDEFIGNEKFYSEGPVKVTHMIMDKIVDEYFPAVYNIEDRINEIDDDTKNYSIKYLLSRVFDIRGDLLKIRRTVNSMRDLLYRVLNSSHLESFKDKHVYFRDIYDHLLKLSDMIESNLEVTADLRDSYLAINANKMNSIMMVLTVITTIFIPLTFIAGIYGMNFVNMPELQWRYGYFITLGVMGVIAVSMIYWFKNKGWFDI